MTNTSATPLMLATWVATVTLLVISSKWVVAKPMEVTKNKSIIGIVITTKIRSSLASHTTVFIGKTAHIKLLYRQSSMAIRVVEFSIGGYKIRKIFA